MQNGKISFKQVIASGDLKIEPLFQMFEQKKKGDSIVISARLKEIRYYPMQPGEREQKLVIPEIHVFVDGISYSTSSFHRLLIPTLANISFIPFSKDQ